MYWPDSINYALLIVYVLFRFFLQKNKKNNELCNRVPIILHFFNVKGIKD